MSVYQQSVSVSDAAFPGTPQVIVPFEPRTITVINESAAAKAFVSMDGVNDQGHLIGSAVIEYGQRVTKVWLRRDGGASPLIQVIAEG